MKNFLIKLWKDEEGAELVEWVVIVGLIAAAAFVTYGILKSQIPQFMNTVLSNISKQL